MWESVGRVTIGGGVSFDGSFLVRLGRWKKCFFQVLILGKMGWNLFLFCVFCSVSRHVQLSDFPRLLERMMAEPSRGSVTCHTSGLSVARKQGGVKFA